MGRPSSPGFTLVELLVVLLILTILMALVLPVILHVMCISRHGAAEVFVDQVVQALKAYELDQARYPPGDGNGSRGLVQALGEPGPKGLRLLDLSDDRLTPDGDLLNPVHPDGDAPIDRIHYRNNRGRKPGPAGVGRPGVSLRNEYDLWCAGCDYDPNRPDSAWSIHRP
ncbi:MAG TPA: prepilin-type N-terminal cleavage/methylation domain-containing protein [Planctomycetota bacterium]|nr:prepilin-type N-terminal cleavage/methylation domain-containing protein [Planctomycetota bacterium]